VFFLTNLTTISLHAQRGWHTSNFQTWISTFWTESLPQSSGLTLGIETTLFSKTPLFTHKKTRCDNAEVHSLITWSALNARFFSQVKIQKSFHGEELPYVFGVPVDSVKFPSHYHFTEKEKLLSEAVMTFWTNFAKTGWVVCR